ncbi:MAG TPA: hypothetical protein VM716_00885 [Gemmatimonadales bacterium]|nr:hypothetical protein [Gemmatimonadales bacterium]
MIVTHQELAAAVRKARDEAKSILNQLQTQRHPDTTRSSSLYLALVTMQKRLLASDPPPPPITSFVAELEQLARDCEGKLAAIKPLLEDAVRLARSQ